MTSSAHQLAASRMFLTAEDVDTIQMLVHRVPADRPLTVIDLGAGSGTTALSVLDANPTAFVITVDIDEDALHWAQAAVLNSGYDDGSWSGFVRRADEPLEVSGPPCLLLHDAGHEREDVEADLRAWLPFLDDDAALWVHDYLPPPEAWGQPASPGVAEAVDALVAEGLIVQEGVAGLGWYGRKA